MKFDLSLTAFLTFYSLLCGISYMSGFWSNFPIGTTDVINFASTSDIIKSAIIPTIMIVLFVSFFSDAERISKHSEKSINLLDFKGLFKRKIFAVGVSVIISLPFYCVAYFYIRPFNSTVYSVTCFVTGVSLSLSLSTIITDKILPHLNFIFRIVFFLITFFLPSGLYLAGWFSGHEILEGRDTLLLSGENTCSSTSTNKYRYITTYNEIVFSYSPNDLSMCIQKIDGVRLTRENI